MDTSPGVFPSRLAISDVELGVSPPISAMAVRYRLPGVEGVADQDRLIDAHLSLMGDKPAQNAVWQAAIGMPVVDQS